MTQDFTFRMHSTRISMLRLLLLLLLSVLILYFKCESLMTTGFTNFPAINIYNFTYSAHLIILDLITQILYGEQYKLRSSPCKKTALSFCFY
jgi:hypothetical protein